MLSWQLFGKLQIKVVMIHWWVYATGWREEKDGKTLVCDKRDRATTNYLVVKIKSWSSLNINVFWSFTKNICLKASEVTSNKIIVMLVTQDLPSSFHSRPVALVHYYVPKRWLNTPNESYFHGIFNFLYLLITICNYEWRDKS